MLHWKDLVHLADEQLATYDVAMVNLACAADLPDAPTPQQIRECLQRLDKMAEATRYYTAKRMPEFHHQPEVYHHSEAKFRVVCMISIIQKLFGVLYNPAKKPADAPFYTADTCIHGALLGEGGTCASLPVVYVAVGRRLG